MSYFNPNKLHITLEGVSKSNFSLPRKYTLTHSDKTGNLFLTIGKDYSKKQVSGWYTRFMRDEVFGEWLENNGKIELHIYVHISGGLIFGWARLRDRIIRSHLPLVFKAIRYSENELIESNQDLAFTPIIVHFKSKRKKFDLIEKFGQLNKFDI